MSVFRIQHGTGDIRYIFEAFTQGGEEFTVRASFSMPRAERTCVDGYHGQAIPAVEVAASSTDIVRHWYFGGRAALPESVNTEVELRVREAMAKEHEACGNAGTLPVAQEKVAVHRAVDPDVSVADIRRAMAIYDRMATETSSASTRTAIWIARNFVTNGEHEEAIAQTIDEVTDDLSTKTPVKEEDRDRFIRQEHEALQDALDKLRTSGAMILEFRPGTSELDKVLDYLADVA